MGLFSGIGKAFGKIGKAVGKVASSPVGGLALGFIPGGGIVSTIARQAIGAAAQKYGGGSAPAQALMKMPKVFPGGSPLQLLPSKGGFGDPSVINRLMQKQFPGWGLPAKGFSGGYLGAGASGTWQRRRRMNPGNVRAARRAIRRIKSVRKLLKSIESQLPKRSCGHSPGRRYARRR